MRILLIGDCSYYGLGKSYFRSFHSLVFKVDFIDPVVDSKKRFK